MRYLLLLLFTALLASCTGRKEDPAVTSAELFSHVSYLASDSLKGRLPGTEECDLAAGYIAGEFRKAGLEKLTDDYLQAFEVITDLEMGQANHFRTGTYEGILNSDFAPFPFTGNLELDANVTFAGYGFDIHEEDLTWNDYKDIDVNGKWVMILMGNPEIDSSSSVFNAYSDERNKAMLAIDKGASGILFVSGPVFDEDDNLIDLSKREGKVSVPVIHIKRTLADKILFESEKTIADLEKGLNDKREPESFSTSASVSASAEVIPTKALTCNVVGYIKGKDKELGKSIIIVGAHYDHLGMGGPGSSSRRPDTLAVHNGADDNASGTAALIEIAEKISLQDKKPARSYLFISFGAEEMGLLGSKYYVDNPVLPLEQTSLMLNMDMVGRLRNRQLQVGGVGTAAEIEKIVEDAAGTDSLQLGLTQEGYGASDHSSFYAMDIPVLFITTGGHSEYHTPEDDVETLNLDGMVEVADYVVNILAQLDSMRAPLTFQEAGPRVQYSPRRYGGITLGIMPDFTDTDDKDGMRVDLVNPGGRAQRGGMKKGDYIMAIEGKPVNGIYDYMYRLSVVEKGQVIVVTVKRNGQELDLLIQL